MMHMNKIWNFDENLMIFSMKEMCSIDVYFNWKTEMMMIF